MIALLLNRLFLAPLCCSACTWQVDTLAFAHGSKKLFGEFFEILIERFEEVDCKSFFFLFLALSFRGTGISFGCQARIG